MPGGRGGRKKATPGSTYTNRSDLATHQPLPLPTGQEYGQRKTLTDSLKAAPIAAPAPVAPAPAPASAAPPAPLPAPPPLNGPTQRPNEPITAGLPVGPGPGPEVLGLGAGSAGGLSRVLAQAASAAGSSDLQFLADQAQKLGQ